MINNFYVLKKGTLSVKSKSIIFKSKDLETISIPIKQITDLYLFIDINPTSNVLKLILNHGIIIHYFNFYDYYLGSIIPKNHTNSGKLLIKEVNLYKNKSKRLNIAKKIVIAGFKNINRVVNYYSRRKDFSNDLKVEKYINQINKANNINHIMIIEANYRKKYYDHISLITNTNSFNRIQKDPKDIVNILINFINSLLYSLIFSEIKKTNISGKIGYLHEVANNRYPLIYDISEIFKPIIVDRLIFKLINRKQITKESLNENYRLKNESIKLIFKEWNKSITQTFYYKPLKRYISYRRLLREELYKLERYLNKNVPYKPYISRW